MTTWIPEYLSKNRTESSNDQTLYIDLPSNEQISHLHIEIGAQGTSTPRTLTTLIDEIEKYEVIADGSKVLYSLEPELAYYVDFISNGGVYPPHGFNYTPLGRETHQFIIPFGRHPFDTDYLLDTAHYNNVQLRIPYTLDTDLFTAGTLRHNIVMYRPLNRVSPTGFIRSRSVRKETSNTAVETLSHNLPMSYPLRYVAARFEDANANITSDCTAIKINVDEGRLILADMNINEWRDTDKLRWPDISSYIITGAFTDQTAVDAHTDYPFPRAIVSSATRALIFKLYYAMGETLALDVYEADGSAVGDSHAVQAYVSGPNPHKCLTLIDGRDEPFDVRNHSEAKIEYTMAALETILHTFVQEVVPGALS